MADNLAWILDQHPGERVVAWAHNMHVSRAHAMGHRLRERFGTAYVPIGMVFNRGGFLARKPAVIGPHTRCCADDRTAFARVGAPVLVADLRCAPAGVVADWFAGPHPMRETGWRYTNDAALTIIARLSLRFDIAIYVEA